MGPSVFEDTIEPTSGCSGPRAINESPIIIDYTSSDGGAGANSVLSSEGSSGVALVKLYIGFGSGGFAYSGLNSTNPVGRFTVPVEHGEGLYEFYTIAQDKAGNVEDPPASADTSVVFDLTMPQSSCFGAEVVTKVPFEVSFAASDAASGVKETRLWFRFAGQSQWVDSWLVQTGESGSFSLDPCAISPQHHDGIYELMTIATDIAGNVEAPPGVPDLRVMLDTTPPQSWVDCVHQTAISPLILDYVSSDALSGVAHVSLLYRFDGGSWQEAGASAAVEAGTFTFTFPRGDGLYEFMTLATDLAGNVEAAGAVEASCVYDTTPPVTTARSEDVVNDPAMNIAFESNDALTGVANVHLFYTFTDLDGNTDDVLRDARLNADTASGVFDWAAEMGPGYYDFHLSATDGVGNVELTDREPQCTCLFDPRLALSSMESPENVRAPNIEIAFTIDVGNDGYDYVTLYYRYGATLAEAQAADWVTSATTSPDVSGIMDFACENGDGCYQFHTRAKTENGLWEPAPDAPDGTTVLDCLAPQTLIGANPISASSEFEITFDSTEAYGIASIDIYYGYQGSWSLLTAVHEANGSAAFDAKGIEGEYRFYSIGTDLAGNVELKQSGESDCDVLVDLSPPESRASVDKFGTGFPIEVVYAASDLVTPVVGVALWARFDEDGGWFDTGLSGSGENGSLSYTPAEPLEGTYSFYAVASDQAGHVEPAPVEADCQMTVDWTKPVTSCSCPPYTNDGTVELTYTASDAVSGVQSVYVWVKAGDSPNAEWLDTGLIGPPEGGTIEVPVSAWGEGAYSFCTRGRDNAGNVEGLADEAPATMIYDATAPASAARLPQEGVSTGTAPVSVPCTASDALSGIASVSLWFRLNGGQWEESGLIVASAVGAFSFVPPYGDGVYQFATISMDNAGNLEALPDAPDGGDLIFDQTASSSSVTFGAEYARQLPMTLQFTANDTTSGIANVSLFVSIDGAAYQDAGLSAKTTAGSFEFTPVIVADGVYRFYTVASDSAGNVELPPAGADATVIFDRLAPNSVASVSSEFSRQFPIQVSYSASDSVSGLAQTRLWVSFDGSGFSDAGLSSRSESGAFRYTPAVLADGAYEFYTTASDLAGNIEAAPAAPDASILVDRTKPTSSCSIDESAANSFPISISYTSSDSGSGIDRVELYYRLDGCAWLAAAILPSASGTFKFTPGSLRDGYYEFYTLASDKAGNAETAAGSDDGISVDASPPESSASSPASVEELPFYISFSAQDNGSGVASTTLWYRFNSGKWVNSGLVRKGTVGQFEFNCPEGQGTYGFCTICTDIAGNLEALPGAPDSTTVYHAPAPCISVQASCLDFDQVNVGERQCKALTIMNVGDADLTIKDISADASVFYVTTTSGLLMTIRPAEHVEVSVFFAPDRCAEFNGQLLMSSNDPQTPTLTVPLTGEGAASPGELKLEVTANSDAFTFGDPIQVDLKIENTGEQVMVDLYLVLTYDLNGPEERHWSASMTENLWTEGISPLVAYFAIDEASQLDYQWWASTLPSKLPMISRSGTYTLRMAAFNAGTSDLVSNLAACQFTLAGEPFMRVSTDEAAYWPDGETAAISLDVDVPYDLTADAYVLVLAPDGQFWSPTGFGEAPWAAEIAPVLSGVTLPGGFAFSGPVFVAALPAAAPFDAAGQFALFTALVEPGTLTPFSDIGTASFSLQ